MGLTGIYQRLESGWHSMAVLGLWLTFYVPPRPAEDWLTIALTTGKQPPLW
jgi:hypothetical protein